MLKELAQELNQILTDVETLTKENKELKIEKVQLEFVDKIAMAKLIGIE